MAQLNFDATQVAPDQGQQDPVPANWYKVVIDKSEIKPTKDGTGQRLEFQFKIIDGQYTNRKIFEGLNIQNSNPIAQEIAFKQLSAICHAVNVLHCQDSTQLHNIPLQVKVSLKAATAQYEAKNEVKAYKNINELIAPSPVSAPTGPAAAPASFAPPPAAGAPAFAPPAAAGQTWVPPAAAQPWAPQAGAPVAQAAAPVAQAPAAALAPPPAVAAPAAAAPAATAVPMPAWAAAAPVAAPAAEAAPAPAQAAPAQATGVIPPWQQPAPTA